MADTTDPTTPTDPTGTNAELRQTTAPPANTGIPPGFFDQFKTAVLGSMTNAVSAGITSGLANYFKGGTQPGTSGAPKGTPADGKPTSNSGITDFSVLLTSNISNLAGDIQQKLGKILGKDYFLNFKVDLKKSVIPELEKIWQLPILQGENAIKFGIVFATDQAIKATKNMLSPVLDLEKRLKEVESAGISAYGQLALAGANESKVKGLGQTFTNVAGAVDQFKATVTDVVNETGKSYQEATKDVEAFGKAGFDDRRLKNFTLSTSEADKSVSGITTAMRLASITGQSMDEIVGNLALQTRSLNTDEEKLMDVYGSATEIARKYNVRLQDVISGTFKAAQGLRYFGDTTKGVTDLYNKMIGALGKGRESLAQELVGALTEKLGSLGNGIQAFIGMTSGIGQGRGAVGSSLEVEEAIAKGDLSKVLDGITDQIQKISGTGVLSRKEALDTGQEQQYLVQRELVKSMLGLSDQQAALLLEAKSKGQNINIQDLNIAAGKQALSSAGQQAVAQQTGPTTALINKAEMDNLLSMTSGLSKDLTDSSKQLLTGSDNFKTGTMILREMFGKKYSGTDIKSDSDEVRRKVIADLNAKNLPKGKEEKLKAAEEAKDVPATQVNALSDAKIIMTQKDKELSDKKAALDAKTGAQAVEDRHPINPTKSLDDAFVKLQKKIDIPMPKPQEITVPSMNLSYSKGYSPTADLDEGNKQDKQVDDVMKQLQEAGQQQQAQDIIIQIMLGDEIIERKVNASIVKQQDQSAGNR